MKRPIIFLLLLTSVAAKSQTCYTITNRTNGNGNPATCGAPNCSGNAKTGHIDISFGASCPGVIPTLVLMSVTSGSMPDPFCFDPGNCISPGTVRYCFRGTNLPSSGFMTLRLTQGATTWSCSYNVNGGGGTLLPVQLSYFKARLDRGKVQLQWKTEQELNNDRFEIERSSNGRSYSYIGEVRGNGTISTVSNYGFTDAAPVKGVNFYRLKQVDIDGHSTYSAVSRVDNRIAGIELTMIYPNPVHNEVKLDIRADHHTRLTARIFDITGKQVFFQRINIRTGNQNLHFSLPHLRPGVHELVISGNTEGMLTEKMVVL